MIMWSQPTFLYEYRGWHLFFNLFLQLLLLKILNMHSSKQKGQLYLYLWISNKELAFS